MTGTNNDNLIPPAPSLEPSTHKEQLRSQLLASHALTSASRYPRWARIAAMAVCGVLLMGAGAATKETYDRLSGRIISIDQWDMQLDEKGNVVKEPPKEGAKGGTSIRQGLSFSGNEMTPKDAQARLEAIKAAIRDRKFQLKSEEPIQGVKHFLYALDLGEGQTTIFPTPVRLEDAKDWDDLQQKQMALSQQRMQRLIEGVSSGKARIIADSAFMYHVCRDTESGKKIEVLKSGPPNGPAVAAIFASPLGSSPESQTTSWQDHLDALASGKRELLGANVFPQFTYELTLPDGTKQTQQTSWIKPVK